MRCGSFPHHCTELNGALVSSLYPIHEWVNLAGGVPADTGQATMQGAGRQTSREREYGEAVLGGYLSQHLPTGPMYICPTIGAFRNNPPKPTSSSNHWPNRSNIVPSLLEMNGPLCGPCCHLLHCSFSLVEHFNHPLKYLTHVWEDLYSIYSFSVPVLLRRLKGSIVCESNGENP
ncbi:MAG: hypothetical protein LZF86_190003 [Nitrospira sp.]|nr:MAG: hypothetical protein LZF86_190003 [Nitrospira sp.]